MRATVRPPLCPARGTDRRAAPASAARPGRIGFSDYAAYCRRAFRAPGARGPRQRAPRLTGLCIDRPTVGGSNGSPAGRRVDDSTEL